MNRITLMIACLSLLFVNFGYSQIQPSKNSITKRVPAQYTTQKTLPAPSATTLAKDIDGGNLLPLDAVVLWGGPGDPDGEFADSLNNWTTQGIGQDTSDALWFWDADGDASDGAYWGGLTAINSPSVSNGAAVFDSDFLDNNGVAGNFGNGPSPAPHTSELISPTIDLTGHPDVALNFYSYYRNFQSEVFVSYSRDDGVTWEPLIQVHGEVPVNETTANAEEMLIYLNGAGDTDKFKFKFVFDGEYYYWIIDDVAIIERPKHDLILESIFYTPLSYGQPQGHIDTDEFLFSIDVSNPGSVTQTNVQFDAVILDPGGIELFNETIVIDELAPGATDSNMVLDETYFPANLDVGVYQMRYFLSADSTDQFEQDNFESAIFEVTTNVFQAETGNPDFETGTTVAGAPQWEIGNSYTTGSDLMGVPYIATSITFAPDDLSAANSLEGKNAIVALVEVTEDFDGGSSSDYLTDENLIVVGLNSLTFTNESDGDEITLTLDNFINDDEPIFLKEDTEYFALVSYPPEVGNIFNREVDYGDRGSFIAFNGGWFGGFTNSTLVPLVRLNIGIFNNVDENPLPESAMGIFPNPVGDVLNAAIDLEKPTDATITITDVMGQVVRMQSYSSLNKDNLQFDTSTFSAGVYHIRLASPEGSRTIKFVVQ